MQIKKWINQYFNFDFRKDIYILANGLMGFFPFFSPDMQKQYQDDIYFLNQIEQINHWEKKLSRQFFGNENLSWTLLFICKAKLFLLFSEFANARIFWQQAKEFQAKISENSSNEAKNWIAFCLDLLDLQIQSHQISIETDKKLTVLANDITHLSEKMHNLSVEIKQHPEHSEEELKLSYQTLEMFLEKNRLLIQKEENSYLEKDLLDRLYNLQYHLNFFYDKTKGLQFPYDNALLLNLIIAEKIRIGFYLGVNMKETFDLVHQFCKYHISVGNHDPISILSDMQWNKTVRAHHPVKLQNNLEQYLLSFVLKINRKNKDEVTIGLKQLSNFVAKNIEERLIIIE
jgi:hypothetical protein